MKMFAEFGKCACGKMKLWVFHEYKISDFEVPRTIRKFEKHDEIVYSLEKVKNSNFSY